MYSLIAVLVLIPIVSAQVAGSFPSLTGTWTTKSRQVFTGPGFYDPVNDKFIEPSLTGISYSFTDDGWYEEAYYRALANPTDPHCPSGLMQWQHGKYAVATNGSLTLTPVAVDGRQLSSSPCKYKEAVFTRYSQPEFFKRYEVMVDKYHNIERLNLYQFNDVPVMPMYLAYQPPQMLPTQTLNPTSTPTSRPGSASKRTADDLKSPSAPIDAGLLKARNEPLNPDHLWWIGVGMIGIGSIAYIVF